MPSPAFKLRYCGLKISGNTFVRASVNKGEKYKNLCRPAYLRSSTYNQELAPFSLLLEIGASGNSLEEAQRAAVLVATELVELIKMM